MTFKSSAFSVFMVSILLLTLNSCKKKEEEENTVTLPSGLTAIVTQDTASPGLVNVKATASNANYYSITFTEGGVSKREETSNGEASYTYSSSGTYSIVINAYAVADQSITITESVVVSIPGPYIPTPKDGPPAKGYTTPTSYAGYTLVWQDEFEGNSLSTTNWNYEIGIGNNGWGNNELQYYKQENVTVSDGILTIEAKKELFNTSQYTSSRITTSGKQSFQYGRIDIRAALPFGQGMWPALWMLGDPFTTVGWPKCGEIDIMEMVGGTVGNIGDNTVLGTAHWDDNGTHAEFGGTKKLTSGILADEFHVYSIIWNAQGINWYLDDQLYHSLDITAPGLSEFHEKFFFIFNVAVGGKLPGDPNSSTVFPQKMFVDYVRVFQK